MLSPSGSGYSFSICLARGRLQLEAGIRILVLAWGDAPAIPDYPLYLGGFLVF